MRYRFRTQRTILPASDLQDHVQLGTNSAWFRRDLIERHKLRFDPRVIPTFEDGHFANRFLLLNPDTEVAFLKSAVYSYRKRADGTSTLDGAKLRPAWCLDVLQIRISRPSKSGATHRRRGSPFHPEDRSLRHPLSLRLPGRPSRASFPKKSSGTGGVFCAAETNFCRHRSNNNQHLRSGSLDRNA